MDAVSFLRTIGLPGTHILFLHPRRQRQREQASDYKKTTTVGFGHQALHVLRLPFNYCILTSQRQNQTHQLSVIMAMKLYLLHKNMFYFKYQTMLAIR